MTLESTNVPSHENLSIKSVKDGSAASVKQATAIDDVIRDTWSKKNTGADVAHGHSQSSSELLMSPIFDFAVGGKKNKEAETLAAPQTLEQKKKSSDVAEGVTIAALDGNFVKTGDFKFKSKSDDPSSAVERAVTAAQAEAAQRVLNNPQWDNQFIRSIVTADRAMRTHPNLADEINQARTAVGQAREDLLAKQTKIDNMIGVLKPSEAKYVNDLVNSDPKSKQRDILLKFYPEIHQQAIERDRMIDRNETANRACDDLLKVSDAVVRSRLDYAVFLNRRGGIGDSREMAHQLADIVRIDPTIVDPQANHPRFHDVRDLARNLDIKNQGIFEEALSRQRMQLDFYFSPKFDRYDAAKAKMIDMALPKKTVYFNESQSIQSVDFGNQ